MTGMDAPGFVDIHHHLLPGLDDGPKSWAESLAMVRAAQEAGIRVVVATPHIHLGNPGQPSAAIIAELVEELRSRVASAGLRLEVLPGAEVYPVPDLARWLERAGAVRPLGQGTQVRYLLLDLPLGRLPPYFDRLIFEVSLAGFIPVIAHPERNQQLAEQTERLLAFVNQGAVAQVTALSLLGGFGAAARRAAEEFVSRGAVQAVATDAHDPVHRSPLSMREAFQRLVKLVGPGRAVDLCERWPLAMARGEPVTEIVPVGAAPASRVARPGLARGLRDLWGRLAGTG